VTLVEYGDYECPYCGLANPIVDEIRRELGDGLRFVFRNFPLSELHRYSEHAAEIAEAAGTHHKFWEMHDMLYAHQHALDDQHLAEYVALLGVPTLGGEARSGRTCLLGSGSRGFHERGA
jgi:protein-disulfide isomerase